MIYKRARRRAKRNENLEDWLARQQRLDAEQQLEPRKELYDIEEDERMEEKILAEEVEREKKEIVEYFEILRYQDGGRDPAEPGI